MRPVSLAAMSDRNLEGVRTLTHLCHGDPPLDDACSVGGAAVRTVRRARRRGRVQEGGGGAGGGNGGGSGRAGGGRAKEGGDHPVGDGVELGDGGAHRRRLLSVLLLVALGPDAAQAVEGNDSDEQLLRRSGVKEEPSPNRKDVPNGNLRRPAGSAAPPPLSQRSP